MFPCKEAAVVQHHPFPDVLLEKDKQQDVSTSLVPSPTNPQQELRITIIHNRVVLSTGTVIQRQVSVENPIKQVAFCRFPADNGTLASPTLCILHGRAFTVESPSGVAHTISLPAAFTGLHPLPSGVVLTGAPSMGPCVLPHPLEELTPLRLEAPSRQPHGPGRPLLLATAASEHERIVWSDLYAPLILTYNTHLERLALWRITPPHPTTTPHDAFPPTHGACATPANRPLIRGVSSVLTGGSAGPAPPPSTAKRHTLRQPDGMLSPAAFSPFPRAAAGVVGALANGGALLLPSKEGPCVCRRVWEQAMSKGTAPTHAFIVHDADTTPCLALLSQHAQRLLLLRLPADHCTTAPDHLHTSDHQKFKAQHSTAQHAAEIQVLLDTECIAAVAIAATRVPTGGASSTPLSPCLIPTCLPTYSSSAHPSSAHPSTLSSSSSSACVSPNDSSSHSNTAHPHTSHSNIMVMDLLVLRPGGGVSLYWGAQRIADVVVHGQPGSGSVQLPWSTPPPLISSQHSAIPSQTSSAHDHDMVNDMVNDMVTDLSSMQTALLSHFIPSGIQDAVGDACTLTDATGRSMRVSLAWQPVHTCVTTVLRALHVVMPVGEYVELYAAYVHHPGCGSGQPQQEMYALHSTLIHWAQHGGAPRPPQPPVKLGSSAISSDIETLGGDTHGTTDGPTSWDTITSSPFHHAAMARLASQPHMRAFLTTHGLQHMLPVGRGGLPVGTGGMGMGGGHGVSSSSSGGGVRRPPAGHVDAVAKVLLTVHALYEEATLCTLRHADLQPLGSLCSALAGVLGSHVYERYYAAATQGDDVSILQSGVHASPPSSDHPSLPPPPNILTVLHCMINGIPPTNLNLPWRTPTCPVCATQKTTHDASPPVCATHDAHPVNKGKTTTTTCLTPRMCVLLRAYTVLSECARTCTQLLIASGSQGDHSTITTTAAAGGGGGAAAAGGGAAAAAGGGGAAAAGGGAAGGGEASPTTTSMTAMNNLNTTTAALHACVRGASSQVVEMLVGVGWGLVDLEHVLQGVVLPVREALQRCRANPCTGWPVAAYRLIGRDDIAATLDTMRAPSTTPPTVQPTSTTGGAPGLSMAHTTTPIAISNNPPSSSTTPPSTIPPSTTAPSTTTRTLPSVLHRGVPYTRVISHPGAHPPCVHHTHNGVSTGHRSGRMSGRVGVAGGVSGEEGYGGEGGVQHGEGGLGGGEGADGMEGMLDVPFTLRFRDDWRLAEVCNLLRTSTPTLLSTKQPPEAADPEVLTANQLKLMCSATRTMALPVGRGAFTLSTLRPVPTQPVITPQLNLAGQLPEQHNATITINWDLAVAAPAGGAMADFTAWPEYHNGCAAGLRLTSASSRLTRTWIVYNRPPQPTYSHAGLLLALGLGGHLACLTAADMYRYLADEHDPTTVSLLLGTAASKAGTGDPTLTKMLYLHVPGRHPVGYPDFEMSSLVQAAALMGLGLLYRDSCNRAIVETMLEEIARRPDGTSRCTTRHPSGGGIDYNNNSDAPRNVITQDREAYALCAGFALGMTALGRGKGAPQLADLRLEERLRNLMLGTADTRTTPTSGTGVFTTTTTTTASRGPMHPLGLGVVAFDLTLGGEMAHPLATALNPQPHSRVEDPSLGNGMHQTVLEGDLVNINVTGPAATIALALLYLKSNDAHVANLFAIPTTRHDLNYVRPDLLQLRVLARCLVMWDEVQATEGWLIGQFPTLVKGPLNVLLERAQQQQGPTALVEDIETIAQAHLSILTGACLGLALRYAGTSNPAAASLLRSHILLLIKAKSLCVEATANNTWGNLARASVESCLCIVALGLSLVMAGSGDLQTLKLLRGLRLRLTLNNKGKGSDMIHYGNHMAVSMGLGFLFLGGGMRTLSRSNTAIAALLAAVYPVFPEEPRENRYHLQALRHVYALATEPRSMQPIDVDTMQPATVPLHITLTDTPGPPPTPPTTDTRGATTTPRAAGGVDARAASSSQLHHVHGQHYVPGQHHVPGQQTHQTPPLRVHDATTHMHPPLAAATMHDGGYEKVGCETQGEVKNIVEAAPCLLPAAEEVVSMYVCGPRYWQQRVGYGRGDGRGGCGDGRGGGGSCGGGVSGEHGKAGGASSPPTTMVGTTVYVQRRLGYLSYADDPSGMRSVLSRTFDDALSSVQHSVDQGFDLVSLCATFSANPFLMAFARYMCTEAAIADTGSTPHALTAACRDALRDALTHDTPAVLPLRVQLETVALRVEDLAAQRAAPTQPTTQIPTATLAAKVHSLHMVVGYYSSSIAAAVEFVRDHMGTQGSCEGWQPLLPPIVVQMLALRVQDALAALSSR